ncbi:uncharacterized protein LOC115630006 isoform X1 [Scaptodrosophila lebanonensis]|uniref:Uncharacterized protein LOC115630006 isoform X1 n=1 Tax=Drosophila lebanonensis TaxID=7225 RepID=A0A6J2U5R7_DROLE|nr:uncharacterized protein LOC115630006 isoform X1 [Scaptodrosophila lebanonensis]
MLMRMHRYINMHVCRCYIDVHTCFNCALSMLISIISAFFVIIIVGALVYYFYYYEEKDDVTKIKDDVHEGFKNAYDKLKDTLKTN